MPSPQAGEDWAPLLPLCHPPPSSHGTTLQVHLVMQYCDMGTLDQAIKRGCFRHPETGQPKLVSEAGRAVQPEAREECGG